MSAVDSDHGFVNPLNDYMINPGYYKLKDKEVLSQNIFSDKKLILNILEQRRDIPFKTIEIYTKDLKIGKRIVEEGAKGVLLEIYQEKFENEVKIESKRIYSRLISPPKDKLIYIGSNHSYRTELIDNKIIRYWKKIYVWATSYDKNCKGCNEWTATGAYLKKGVVAVDPKVIPLHTKMYIPGYGFGKAEDTGGKVKGNRIDLAFDDLRHSDWSARWVTVYLLNDPKEK